MKKSAEKRTCLRLTRSLFLKTKFGDWNFPYCRTVYITKGCKPRSEVFVQSVNIMPDDDSVRILGQDPAIQILRELIEFMRPQNAS